MKKFIGDEQLDALEEGTMIHKLLCEVEDSHLESEYEDRTYLADEEVEEEDIDDDDDDDEDLDDEDDDDFEDEEDEEE